MAERGGESSGEAGQKGRMSLAEIQIMGLVPFTAIDFLILVLFGINMHNPLLGLGAVLLILVASSSLILLLWKVGQRENPPFWFFKTLGFWLMAVAFVAGMGVLVMMVVCRMILLPSVLTSPFVSALPFIAMGMMLFMGVALVVWMAQVNLLKSRQDLQHWLDTGEL